ncbi:MAG: ASCH domain-containing protein [Lachnospiraceae bacterium]|nr:ASCH domain-containing protein [Lachnospiraceae bacterium]
MRITSLPLKMIREGKKTIELRLYDEKRKAISIGDTISFCNTEDKNDTLNVRVEDLHVFASFEELYQKLPLLECGYTEEDIDNASPDDMEEYYPKEKQARYGVVGIKVSLI